MWSDKDKIRKFIMCANKWSEFYLEQETNLPEDVVALGFERSQKHSHEILIEFTFKSPDAHDFLSGWVEVGLFAGFLAGYKNANTIISRAKPDTVQDSLESGVKRLAIPVKNIAKKFASELTEKIFNQMLNPPKSLLIEGLSDQIIELLKISYESSLYAGFIDAIEVSYREGWVDNAPLGLDTILVN